MRRTASSFAAALAAGGATATALVACAPAHAAVCMLSGSVPGQPDSGVRGVVRATQRKEGEAPVRLHVRITGLAPHSTHGFHVHALGNLVEGCLSAGGHFNPSAQTHGGPTDAVRHAGDLGNVVADAQGAVDVVLTDSGISLAPGAALNIVGRAIVLHADADDLGRGGFADSLTTGHAGARIACGVVGVDADVDV